MTFKKKPQLLETHYTKKSHRVYFNYFVLNATCVGFAIFPVFAISLYLVSTSWANGLVSNWNFSKANTSISGKGMKPSETEFEKTIVFHIYFLENSENFLNFAKSSKKFGKFLNFLGLHKIFWDFQVFFYVFKIFLNFLEHSRKIKKIQKGIRKYWKFLDNFRKFKKI